MKAVSTSDLKALAGKIQDAAGASGSWPEVLQSVTRSLNVAGAAFFTTNKATRKVDWICTQGSAENESRFAEYYAQLDPFIPLLRETSGWHTLSERFSPSILKRSEWYNDFIVRIGIADLMATCLLDTPQRSVIFGVQQRPGRDFGDQVDVLRKLTKPFTQAASRHLETLYSSQSAPVPNILTEHPNRRYFFDLCNGREYRDYVGTTFSCAEDATTHGKKIAIGLVDDKGWKDFQLTIRDEDGSIVLRVPVRM